MIIPSPAEIEQRQRAEKERAEAERKQAEDVAWKRRQDKKFGLDRIVAMSALAGMGLLAWQSYETHRSVTVTQQAVEVARDTLKASQDEAKASKDRSERQAKDSEIEAKASRAAADAQSTTAIKAARELAQMSLDGNLAAARLDQRAWIGNTEISPAPVLAVGSKMDYVIKLVNSGRTPARAVTQTSAWSLWGVATPIDFEGELKKNAVIARKNDIQPQGHHYSRMKDPPLLDQAMFNFIESGQVVFYMYGIIDYSDIFGRAHKTRYCYQLSIEVRPRIFIPCTTHNQGD